jgi:hypothetical protein
VKKYYPLVFLLMFVMVVSLACEFSMPADQNAEKTKNALAVEQTKLVIQQTAVSQANIPSIATVQPVDTATPTLTATAQMPSETPTQTLTNQALPGFSNYIDDFTDPNSGWPEKTTGENRSWYATDHYHIQVDQVNTQYVVTSGYSVANGSVIAYGLLPDQTSSPQAYLGVVCRLMDFQNYYFFEVSYDGYYRIGKFYNGVFSLIGMSAPKTSTAIKIGDYNQIQADCLNDELSLTVNNIFIETVYDNTLTSGDTGLCATADTVPGIIAAFGNFTAEDH